MKRDISFLFVLLISATLLEAKTCSVLDYGGKADNKTDLGPAVLSAYKYVLFTFHLFLFQSLL
jgi:hypothetical protein